MTGEVVVDFLKVFCGVSMGPENKFERAVGIVRFFGFKFADIGSSQAAATGAVIDLDADFKFNHTAGLEDSSIAGGYEGFGPEHDLAGAGEVLDSEDAKRFSGFGHAGFDRADHACDGVAFAWVFYINFIDQTDAVVFIGVENAAIFIQRMAGDVET